MIPPSGTQVSCEKVSSFVGVGSSDGKERTACPCQAEYQFHKFERGSTVIPRILRSVIIGTLCLSLAMPAQLLSAAPASVSQDVLQSGTKARQPAVTDVSLDSGGRLNGQVVNADGEPVSNQVITVQYQGSDVAQAITDDAGRFAVHGLRGGVHNVVAGADSAVYRLWTSKAAPPAAKQDCVLVTYAAPLGGWGGFHAWLRNPWVFAGLVAAAIAIPVGINAADDDDYSGPAS